MAILSGVKRVARGGVPCGAGKGVVRALLALALFLFCCGRGEATPPTVSQLAVADVTPASFAVAWLAGEPATGTLTIFQADCTTPVASLPMTAEGNDTTGFLRVTVAGLAANTGYCYQTVTTSKGTAEVTVYPLQPASVTTATAVTRVTTVGGVSVPFANDLVRIPPVYLPTPADTPDGMLVLLTLADGGGLGPLSLLLTTDPATGYFNMNNLFSAGTGTSLNLTGGERVRISERHGKSGCAIDRFRTVPADGEVTKVVDFAPPARPQDIDANGKVNILDILRVAAGVGSSQGDPCFNGDLDLNGDGKVDLQDVVNAEGNFDAAL